MTLSAGTRLCPDEILAPPGVAIKVSPQALIADPDVLARLEREALAVAALSHPNILAIHDFGTHGGGAAYAVMELLEGETLHRRPDMGPIPQC